MATIPRPWTEAEDSQLVALCRGPSTMGEMASKLGRSRSSIMGRIYRLRKDGAAIPARTTLRYPDLTAEVRALWLASRSVAEIGAELGISDRVVRARLTSLRSAGEPLPPFAPRPRAWTPQDDALLRQRRLEGATASQIGQELQRTESAVFARFKMMRDAGTPAAVPPVEPRDPREDQRLLELWGGPALSVEICTELQISDRIMHRRIAAMKAAGAPVPVRHWNAERESQLRALARHPFREVARTLEVSEREVKSRLTALGLLGRPDPARSVWSREDDDRLVTLWAAERTMPAIGQALGRTTAAVNLRVTQLRRQGYDLPGRTRSHPWTDEDEQRLCSLWADGATLREIAIALGRRQPSVAGHVTRLRRKGVDLYRRIARAPARFSPHELKTVEDMWASATIEEIALRLGCSTQTVEHRVEVLRREGHPGLAPRAPRPRAATAVAA